MMFKNFGTVFRFTFRNQTNTKGFRLGTIIMSVLLLAVPIAIFALVGVLDNVDDDENASCGADKIYVVNEAHPDVDFNALNTLGIENYTDIQYVNSKSVAEAVETIKANTEGTSIVLEITENEKGYSTRIIMPDKCALDSSVVEHYDNFIEKSQNMFVVLASGADVQELSMLSMPIEKDSFKVDGYRNGTSLFDNKEEAKQQENDAMLKGFNLILVFVCIMVIYTIAIMYGNGIMQNIVMEKSSKLMDTMLVSIHPQAMIFGKMMGCLAAAIIQFFSWILSLVIGLVVGCKVLEIIKPGKDYAVVTFFKSFGELNVFTPLSIIIGVLVLIFGIVFYCSIAAICGAISGSKEEAASNQAIFVIIILVSFYIVLFGGHGGDYATWMFILPSTSAMILPAQIVTGSIDVGLGLAGLGAMVATTVLLIILAGKIYTMMALYKGNKVNIAKAFKMLLSKR